MCGSNDWPNRPQGQGPSAYEGFGQAPMFQAPPMPVPPAPRRRRATVVLSTVLAALLFLGAGVGLGWGLFRPTTPARPATSEGSSAPPLTLQPSTGPSGSTGGPLSLQDIVSKVEPGIVDINTYLDTNSLGSSSMFGAPGPSAQPLGAGT